MRCKEGDWSQINQIMNSWIDIQTPVSDSIMYSSSKGPRSQYQYAIPGQRLRGSEWINRYDLKTKSTVYRGICKIEITIFNIFENFLHVYNICQIPICLLDVEHFCQCLQDFLAKSDIFVLQAFKLFRPLPHTQGLYFFQFLWGTGRLGVSLPVGTRQQCTKDLFSMSCSFPAAGGAAVVFIVVQESLQS